MTRSEIDVLNPQTLDEALMLLHQDQPELRIIAGGSDVIVQLRDGVIKTKKLLNLLPLKELRFIRKIDDRIHTGSLTTYSDIVRSELVTKYARLLADAARQIGAIQLQNTATLGGNLGNASPAGDSLPPLYALNAVVVTRSNSGRREIPIEDFFIGYRKTALRPDELIEEVYFDALSENDRSAFLKLGLREANAISIVNVAVVLRGRKPDDSFTNVRIALGAVAPTIRRASKCEQALLNRRLDPGTMWKASTLAAEDTSPIDDIRGSAEYRKHVVTSLVYEGLYEAVVGRVKPHE